MGIEVTKERVQIARTNFSEHFKSKEKRLQQCLLQKGMEEKTKKHVYKSVEEWSTFSGECIELVSQSHFHSLESNFL